jgi:thiol-disulfide isomerase/thioredoxin
MNYLSIHNKAFRAEWLKLRHSGMIWLLIGATIFIPAINTIADLLRDEANNVGSRNIWNQVLQNNLSIFTGFFFPMFLVLMVTRLVYLEYRSDTWKLLETQPVPRFAIYFAKWEVALLISLCSLLGVALFALANGGVLLLFRKDYGLHTHAPTWSTLLLVIGRYWVGALGIISIQYFLALLMRSFAWPLGVGLIMIIAGSIFAGFGVLNWFPYAASLYTTRSYEGSMTGKWLLHHEVMGLLWGLLFLWLGYQFFVRKSFVRAFVLPLRHGLATAVVLGLFVGLAWGINQPSVLDRYHRTVLAGTLSGDAKVESVALLQAPTNDTLLLLPVRGGKFHAVIPQPLDTGVYTIRAGRQQTQVFMGTADSTYLDWEIKEKMSTVKATGTRVAENAYLQQVEPYRSWALTNNAYQYDPKEYARRALNEFKKVRKNIYSYKTVDNIRPADDFRRVQEKLLAVQFLNWIDNYYPQIHSVYFPNDKLEYPKSLDELRQVVQLNDPSLVGYANYRTYVTELYRTRSHRNDSLLFYYLDTEMSDGKVKDYLLYEAAQANLSRIKDSARRDHLLHTVLPSFSNARMRDNLSQAAGRLSNMGRGRKGYNFKAEALNGKQIQLSQLAGRYIVVDVWATWCAPCKKENPAFDELANRYTSERLAFVSVSVDEDANQWRMQAANRGKKVLQLRVADGDEAFSRHYALNTIPRFMLIDPKGNIVDADMPRPTDPEFEAFLEKEVGGL